MSCMCLVVCWVACVCIRVIKCLLTDFLQKAEDLWLYKVEACLHLGGLLCSEIY